jgi:hypothetical protein
VGSIPNGECPTTLLERRHPTSLEDVVSVLVYEFEGVCESEDDRIGFDDDDDRK